MTFKVVTPGFEQTFERWTDALAKANSMKSSLKSWFKDIRILENGAGEKAASWQTVWTFGRGRSHPEYLGPGTYDRLARLFIAEAQQEAIGSQLQPWQIRDYRFEWGRRTYMMGVLNVTPDSFSDGGQFNTVETALAQAKALVEAGMDILDIGGQSTRPGSMPTSLEEECDRVIPIIQSIRCAPHDWLSNIPISVDTTRSEVARAALEAGADIINDISGGLYEPEIFKVVAEHNAPLMLMHLRGTPETMQQMTDYDDLMGEIVRFLAQQADRAVAAGVDPQKIAVDPGIGFAKTAAQNITILRELEDLKALRCPILVGTSRKSFIGKLLNQPEAQKRVWGTAATVDCAIAHGADIVRVHDGPQMRDVCRMADALWR
ncbi:MAG: dihydropteroate synthase FolP [Phormidesmis priestleyi Ana]|uniref:Dihydropteroate synthase n=1 Tax=Phormidesmis priestleyi Ana TaxID=1666911 RepID=A0A0P7YV41_9CYAN|nr:MAG: dihydropteroate synthase FolP [Phormidesmis priestleyi Ana]